MRTCRAVGPERLFTDCRNAAQCESLGHRPRIRFISNTKALKGQNCGRASSFRPVRAVCGSIYFSQGDALGFRILGLWPGTHSASQCPEISRPLTATVIRLQAKPAASFTELSIAAAWITASQMFRFTTRDINDIKKVQRQIVCAAQKSIMPQCELIEDRAMDPRR